MHELGILYKALEQVNMIAIKQHIKKLKHITLEIGDASGYVPAFLYKLYPIAKEKFPIIENAELIIRTIPGRGFTICEIGY